MTKPPTTTFIQPNKPSNPTAGKVYAMPDIADLGDFNIFGGFRPEGGSTGTVDVILLLDGSGSMSGRDAPGAARAFLDELSKEHGVEYRITYVWFSTDTEVRGTDIPLSKFKLVYETDDVTALWDAFHAAHGTKGRESGNPVLFVVISDGYDNVSSLTAPDIKAEVAERVAWGNWTYVWLGIKGSQAQADIVGITNKAAISSATFKDDLRHIAGAINKGATQALKLGQKRITLQLTDGRT